MPGVVGLRMQKEAAKQEQSNSWRRNPEKKPDSSKSERPASERRPPQNGNNLVWYLLALGVVTLLFVAWLGDNNQVEIPYGQLVKTD